MMQWPTGDDGDETLLGELDDALAGAVSERSRAAARAAFAWRTIDEDLMSLAHDSSASDEVLVRGGASATRVLGFEAAGFSLEVEVEVEDGGGAGAVMGQVHPGRACRVAVLTRSGEHAAALVDDSGLFSLDVPARGPVRFTVSDDGATVSTEWLTL